MNLAQMDVQQLTAVVTQAVNHATTTLHDKIDGMSGQIVGLEGQIVGLEGQIVALTLENEELKNELVMVKADLANIHQRLDGLEQAFAGAAPFFTRMLEEQDSMLLDPDWKEIRDEAEPNEFDTSWSYVKSSELFSVVASYIDQYSVKSASIVLGKAIAGFYKAVFGFAPRQLKGKSHYHQEENLLLEYAAKIAIDQLELKLAQ